MNLNEATAALRSQADQLEAVAAENQPLEVIESLDRLERAAERASASWSGSWFGYHSRVYYKDFKTPPPGARFSSEWGFMDAFSNQTVGEWVELTYDDAVNRIMTMAGNPDLATPRDNATKARSVFESAQTDIISILSSVRANYDDVFLTTIFEGVKALSTLTAAGLVKALMPSGDLMSRDTTALLAGLHTPPHIAVLGKVIEYRNPFEKCNDLAKLARQAAIHIERVSGGTPQPANAGSMIFIGHGRSQLWRVLKDFIQDRLGLLCDEFNRVPIAGVTNPARLAEMMDSAGMAFLVLTAEDEDKDGKLHARENVIHEAGLFQGRLGFLRAIVLLEEGCEQFSNIDGLGQLRFPKGAIEATFEDVRRVLEREGLIE